MKIFTAKRQRYSVAKACEMIFDDGSEHGGISSGEESELDGKLENPSAEPLRNGFWNSQEFSLLGVKGLITDK